MSRKVQFIDKGYYKKEIKKRWPESLSDSHERALLLSDYMAEKLNDLKKQGEITDENKVCFLIISHGMMVE